jgi:ADP-heptose:LPS heptosyltransferase
MLKKLEKLLGLNPLDRMAKLWKKEEKQKILFLWNRGLGDIPLWLYGMFLQIKNVYPQAQLFVLTRKDLQEGFAMLQNVKVLGSQTMQRGLAVDLDKQLAQFQLRQDDFDVVIEKIEPKAWIKWQRKWVVPKLSWPGDVEDVAWKFGLDLGKKYLGVHLSTETGQFYADEKNWPLENFLQVFQLQSPDIPIVLFGHNKQGSFGPNILDLRGQTTLFEMLTIVKNFCRGLLAPDSGVLCMVYYLACDFPLTIVSLWGNPRVGILKQGVASPNRYLRHIPLLGKQRQVKNITVDKVIKALQQI